MASMRCSRISRCAFDPAFAFFECDRHYVVRHAAQPSNSFRLIGLLRRRFVVPVLAA